MFDEHTGRRIASLAGKGLADPRSLTLEEVREVCGSALTQVPDHLKPSRADDLRQALARALGLDADESPG